MPVTRVTFVGHATVLIEADGTRLLTDPILRPRVGFLRRLGPLPAVPGVTSPDAVLISHGHLDHLDIPSLRRLPRSARAIVPRSLGRLVRRGGPADVTEVRAGDRLRVGELGLSVTHADHDGRRLPLGQPAPAVGYLVDGRHRVYFAGDTDLFEEMSGIAPTVDLALLPISGWGRTLPPGHLDPERAARAAVLLGARCVVPIHWGTLVAPGAAGHPDRPVRAFARLAAALAPNVEVRILRPGESVELSADRTARVVAWAPGA